MTKFATLKALSTLQEIIGCATVIATSYLLFKDGGLSSLRLLRGLARLEELSRSLALAGALSVTLLLAHYFLITTDASSL